MKQWRNKHKKELRLQGRPQKPKKKKTIFKGPVEVGARRVCMVQLLATVGDFLGNLLELAGFATEAGTDRLLYAAGVGGASSFVRMLTCRLLQDFCLSCGALVALGQGSYLCAWRMLVEADSSIKPSWATHPPRQRILETLLPFVVVFRRLVQHHLGQAWVRFVTFQTVTHLLCELRKWLETTRVRKEGHEGRKASYLALAATFMEHHRLPETWQAISSSDGAPNQGVLKRGTQIASRFFP